MAQVAKYQVPAHPSGLDMRTQLNAIILALIGDNSGPTAPAEMYPGMMWGDTTANRLKRRNNANSAWIDIGPIDNFLGDVSATANNKVSKTGDTMTGALGLYASSGAISSPLYLNSNGYNPHIRSNNVLPGFEWVNNANTQVIASLTDTGQMNAVNFSTGVTGSTYWRHQKGQMWMRGDQAIGNSGGVGFINNAGNAWRFQLTDEGYWNFPNYGWGGINISNSSTAPDTNGFQASLGPGYLKLNEYSYGAYIDLARARSEDYQWRIHYQFTNNYLEFISRVTSKTHIFSSDGNYFMPVYNDWLSNVIAGRSPKGTQIQWYSGINELGALAPGAGDVTRDAGNPWCMEGLRMTGGGATWIWPRCIWYATP